MVRINRNLQKINIEGKMGELEKYIEGKKDILALFLYGSYGTKYQTPLSDVDFAYLPSKKMTLNEELEIIGEFTDVLDEEDVSVVNMENIPLLLQFEILKKGKKILCKDENKLTDFVEYVIKRHGDFIIDLEQFYKDYDEGLKEEFLHGRQNKIKAKNPVYKR